MATEGQDTARHRWLGVGRSSSPDSVAAAYGATEGALTGPDPKLLMAFGSDSYDLPALLGAIRERAPDTP
ncbi:MAG: hypothetical protein H0V29_06350 [Thermoleophilaceae bacterium]|nr:hypothetical protein [Thermoleophilaceae bacterium]